MFSGKNALNLLSRCVEGSGLFGFALMGSRIHAASLILPDNIRSKDSVMREMTELRRFYTSLPSPNNRAFALFFTCCGRGKSHYGEANVETAAFRDLFPKVPVSGIFSLGEFGWNYWTNCDLVEGPIYRTYSTAIMLVVIV